MRPSKVVVSDSCPHTEDKPKPVEYIMVSRASDPSLVEVQGWHPDGHAKVNGTTNQLELPTTSSDTPFIRGNLVPSRSSAP